MKVRHILTLLGAVALIAAVTLKAWSFVKPADDIFSEFNRGIWVTSAAVVGFVLLAVRVGIGLWSLLFSKSAHGRDSTERGQLASDE